VFWIEYFHCYLHGSKFHVVMDHAALKWLMDAKEQWGCLAWWAMKLQPYEFEIVYRAGVKHVNMDTMMRLPIVSDLDIVAVVGEPQAKRAVAIKGCEFMWWVAMDLFGDLACAAACQASPAPDPVEEATTTPTTEWPLDEEWECSWPASKDWF
jgi:hypothetical protein